MSINVKEVGKSLGTPPTQILKDMTFSIADGEFVALTGRSGSGKSTLLYLLSTLDSLSEGSIEIDGRNINAFSKEELYRFRNENVGFVFQFHYLLAELSALENVILPALKFGQENERKKYAVELLEQFGLGDKLNRLPRQLSGGEQQRVAIARSLVMKPKYLFADEPTGSLDSVNGDLVMKIIREVNQKGTTVVMVTHDPGFAKTATRQIHLVDGRMVKTSL